MIPKIIHYCWFGRNALPPLAQKCITSWRKYFPDYEIKEWNEENFDITIIDYVKEAYSAKQYAFVSDYARFWILYKYGGVYFDTDVEVIKSMDDILLQGSFMGCEKNGGKEMIAVAPGLGMAAIPKLEIYKEILALYESLHFINPNGSYNQTTIVDHITPVLIKNGLKNISSIQVVDGIFIYPKEYFCPLDSITKKLDITPNTRTIHPSTASGHTRKHHHFSFVSRYLWDRMSHQISLLFKSLRIIK